VDPVPDPMLLRKCGSAGNRTQDPWVSSQELCLLDYRGGRRVGKTPYLKLNKMHTLTIPNIPTGGGLAGGHKTGAVLLLNSAVSRTHMGKWMYDSTLDHRTSCS
jgi:hypothetical protein